MLSVYVLDIPRTIQLTGEDMEHNNEIMLIRQAHPTADVIFYFPFHYKMPHRKITELSQKASGITRKVALYITDFEEERNQILSQIQARLVALTAHQIESEENCAERLVQNQRWYCSIHAI